MRYTLADAPERGECGRAGTHPYRGPRAHPNVLMEYLPAIVLGSTNGKANVRA